jgi:hypothetical protein
MNTALSPPPVAATVGIHPWRHFVRCYIEMNIVMLVGMGVAIKLFTSAVGALIEPITWQDALVEYPAQALLVMSIGMTLPMIAWMRQRCSFRPSHSSAWRCWGSSKARSAASTA